MIPIRFEFDTYSPNYSPLNNAGALVRSWGGSKCGDRITAAQTRYEEAYRRWQAESKADDLKGTG